MLHYWSTERLRPSCLLCYCLFTFPVILVFWFFLCFPASPVFSPHIVQLLPFPRSPDPHCPSPGVIISPSLVLFKKLVSLFSFENFILIFFILFSFHQHILICARVFYLSCFFSFKSFYPIYWLKWSYYYEAVVLKKNAESRIVYPERPWMSILTLRNKRTYNTKYF